jgi:hypothetical protein
MRKACKILSKEETGVNKPLKKPTQLKKKKKSHKGQAWWLVCNLREAEAGEL